VSQTASALGLSFAFDLHLELGTWNCGDPIVTHRQIKRRLIAYGHDVPAGSQIRDQQKSLGRSRQTGVEQGFRNIRAAKIHSHLPPPCPDERAIERLGI
jgi:hypothetical protein